MRRPCLPIPALVLACGLAARAADPAAEAFLAGDLERARTLLEREIAAGTAAASRQLLLARVQFLRGDWPAARAALDGLLRADPTHPEAGELMGRVLFRQGEFEACLPRYRASLDETDQPELRLEMAEALDRLGRTVEAVAALKRVIADDRAWPRAHYLLGRIRLASGLGHWASRELLVALRLKFDAPDLHGLLARALAMEGRITGPLIVVRPLGAVDSGTRTAETIQVRPAGAGQPGAWLVAESDTALYQVEEALAAPGAGADDSLRLLAARCWLAAGVTARANHWLSQAAATPEADALRQDAVLAAGDLAAFETLAGQRKPEDPEREAYVARLLDGALLAESRGDLDAAARLLAVADSTAPGRSDVLRRMVGALERLGRAGEARARMKLLAELHPDSPDVRLLASRYGQAVVSAPEGRP